VLYFWTQLDRSIQRNETIENQNYIAYIGQLEYQCSDCC